MTDGCAVVGDGTLRAGLLIAFKLAGIGEPAATTFVSAFFDGIDVGDMGEFGRVDLPWRGGKTYDKKKLILNMVNE